MDAITLLKDDHRRIEKLFRQFERTGDGARKTRKRIAGRMAADLRMHTTLEEHVFYPLVRQSVAEADFVILEAREEHHVVELLLDELAKISPRDERFAPKVAVLIGAVREHVEWEEHEIFPLMRNSIGRTRVVEIGDAMRKLQRKAKTASPKDAKKAARKALKRVA